MLLTSALGLSLLVTTPAFAADECGTAPPGGGTVTCTTAGNNYSNGVTYTPPADLTVVLDTGVEIYRTIGGPTDNALTVNAAGAANVAVSGRYANIAAGAGLQDGISITHPYGSTGTTSVYVGGFDTSVYGQRRGINVYGGGNVSIAVSTALGGSAGGGYGDGIHVEGLTKGASVNVTTYGSASSAGSGIRVFGAEDGDITITAYQADGSDFGIVANGYGAGNVSVAVGREAFGNAESAILAQADDGNVNVNALYAFSNSVYSAAIDAKTFGSGSISVTAPHVYAQRTGISAGAYGTGDVSISAGVVRATDRDGVYAYSKSGDINVGVTRYAGGKSAGVAAVSASGDIAINIASGGVAVSKGAYGSAIYASSGAGGVDVNAAGATLYAMGTNGRGITAYSAGSKDININVGTVVARGSSTPGYDTDAIHVRATGTGAINITAGKAVTYGDFSDAIFASGKGAVNVTAGYAATTGYGGIGVEARSTNGPVQVNVSDAVAIGNYGAGVVAHSNGDVTVNAGIAVGIGYGGHGIIARSYGGNVSVGAGSVLSDNEGIIATTTGAGDVAVNLAAGGAIATSGYDGAGIDAEVEKGSINITAGAGSGIATLGSNGQGIYALANGPGSININVDTVGTLGGAGPYHAPTAIFARQLGGGDINISANQVATTGDYARGIDATATTGKVNIYTGSVGTFGYAADAIHVTGGSAVSVVTSGYTGTFGAYAAGISVDTFGHVDVENLGTVHTYGQGSTGIAVSTVNGDINIGSYSVTSEQGAAITAISSNGVVNVDAFYAASHGATTPTIEAFSDRKVSVYAGTVVATGPRATAISAGSTGGNVSVSAYSVKSNGYGILANSTAGSTQVAVYSLKSYYAGITAMGQTGASVDVAAGGLIQTYGFLGTGIRATSPGAITISAGAGSQIITGGYAAAGIVANSTGDGAITIDGASGSQIRTTGANSGAIFADAFGSGGISIDVDSVQTKGIFSAGIHAYQGGSGKIDITSKNVSTSGLLADGIDAYAAGAVSIVSGDVTTTGALSNGIHASSYTSTSVTMTGDTVTHGAGSYGVLVSGIGPVTINNQGEVHTYGPANGIWTSSVDGVSIVSNKVTAANGVGISALANGDVSIQASNTSAAGGYDRAIQAVGDNVSVAADRVSSSGYSGYGVLAVGHTASVVINPGGLLTDAGNLSTGIEALATIGASNVTTTGATVQAQGVYADGIIASSRGAGAQATVEGGVTNVSGDGSLGILAKSKYGDAVIVAQTTSASGTRALGLRATAGDTAQIIASDVTEAGDHGLGVSVVGGYNGPSAALGATGDGIVLTTGTVSATGAGAVGIAAVTGGGNVSITGNNVLASGVNAFGVRGRSLYGGQVAINVANVSVTGAGATGVFGRTYGGGGLSITAGHASSDDGEAIDAQTDGGNISIQANSVFAGGASNAIDVITPGGVSGGVGLLTAANGGIASTSFYGDQTWTIGTLNAGTFGVFANAGVGNSITLNLGDVSAGTEAVIAGTGQFHINISAGSEVTGGTGPALWLWQAGASTVDNAGTLRSASGVALEADTGPVTLNNSGMVIGSLVLAGGDDTFNNAAGGTFAAASSDFGGGANVFNNAGTLAFAASGGPAGVVLGGLTQFNNTGVIDLSGRGVGDVLLIPGGFNGSGASQLKVDAFLGGPGSVSDVLKVNGAITGSTAVKVNDTNPGLGAYNPTGIVVVDASGGAAAPPASAFTLSGGPIQKGLWAYNLYATPEKTFVLASTPSATALDIPYLAGAVQGLFGASLLTLNDRLDDLRSTNIASAATVQLAALGSDTKVTLPGGAPKDNGVWARVVGGHEDSQATQTVSLFGASTTYDLGYKQNYVALQSGFDRAVQNGRDTFLFGGSFGYANSSGDFLGGGSFSMSGVTAAAYAEYLHGGFYGHVVGQGQWLTLDYHSLAGTAKPHSQTYGISAGGGYRIQQGQWFVEPDANLDWADVNVDSFMLQNANVSFRDGEMLRGQARLNFGQVLFTSANKTQVEPTVTVGVVKAFEGGASADIASGPGLVLTANDHPAWGEFAFGIRVIDLGSGLSGFVRGQYDGLNKQYSGYSFKAGFKISF